METLEGKLAPEEKASPQPAVNEAPALDAATVARAEKAALQKLELARSLATAANRVFLLFFVSLALLWVQRVLPLMGQVDNVGLARSKYLSALKVSRFDLEQAYQKQVNDVRADPLELPGGFKLNVPAYYTPLVWAFVCLTLLSYLHFCRRRHFALTGRNLRILREDAGYTPAALADVCPALPWWLAPLPARDGSVVTSQDLYLASGWVTNQRRVAMLSRLAVVLLVLLQFLTLYVSWRTSTLVATQTKAEQFGMLETTLLIAALTALVALDWLRPVRVPDNRVDEVNPNQLGRRAFVGSSALAALSLVPYPAGNLLRSMSRRAGRAYGGPSSPRYKHKRKQAWAIPGGVLPSEATGLFNPASEVLHYVSHGSANQRCLGGIAAGSLRKMMPMDFVSASLSPPPGRAAAHSGEAPAGIRAAGPAKRPRTHVHQDCASWAFQQEATKALAKNEPAAACEALFRALEPGRSDLRLYDRIASITVQHDLSQQRQRLIKLAETVAARSAARATLTVHGSSAPDTMAAAEPSMAGGLIRRMIGQVPDMPHGREPRRRSRCDQGKLVARPQAHRGKVPVSEALARRVRNWKDPGSKWFKKWSSGKRQWHEPVRAARCRVA